MSRLIVDFITSLDGYGAAEGWPGWWGLQGPEYLAWLAEQPRDYTTLMGATTYRLMCGFAEQPEASGIDPESDEAASIGEFASGSRMVSCIAARSSSLKTAPDDFAVLVCFVDAIVSAMCIRPSLDAPRAQCDPANLSMDRLRL